MTSVYRPSRIERRRAAGSRCALCPNRMTHHDVLAVVQDGQAPVYAHTECLRTAAEMADAQVTEEDVTQASTEAESEDSTPSAKDSTDLDSGPYTSVASLHGGLA